MMIKSSLLFLFYLSATVQASEGGLRRNLAYLECGVDHFLRVDVEVHNLTCSTSEDLADLKNELFKHLNIPHATFDTKVHRYYDEKHMCVNFLTDRPCSQTTAEDGKTVMKWKGGGQCVAPSGHYCPPHDDRRGLVAGEGKRRKLGEDPKDLTDFLADLLTKRLDISKWSENEKLEHLSEDQLAVLAKLEEMDEYSDQRLKKVKEYVKAEKDKAHDVYDADKHALQAEEDALKVRLDKEEDDMKARHEKEIVAAKRISKSEEKIVKKRHQEEVNKFNYYREKVEDEAVDYFKARYAQVEKNKEIDERMVTKQEDLAKTKRELDKNRLDKLHASYFKKWESEIYLDVAYGKRIGEREAIIQHDIQNGLKDGFIKNGKCFDSTTKKPTVIVTIEQVASTEESFGLTC